MDDVSILVPYADRAGDERARHWEWLRGQLVEAFPDVEIVVGTDVAGEDFRKGRAVEDARSRCSGNLYVIQDADCYVDPGAIEAAVQLVRDGVPWVIPHGLVYRLNPRTTADVVSGALCGPPHPIERGRLYKDVHEGPAGGGIVVLGRYAYETVGGMDSRFHGWGGDDIAFGWALDTLVGEHVRLGALCWHLWHYPLVRRTRHRVTNEALAGRYLEARGDVARMAALVSGAA